MNLRTNVASIKNKRMLSVTEGCAYTGLGRNTFRKYAEQIGAVQKIGSRFLFDKKVIDAALDRVNAE